MVKNRISATMGYKYSSRRVIVLVLSLIILGSLILSSCSANEKPYKEALLQMKNGNYADALSIFNSLPTDYKETGYYSDTIRAMDLYLSGNWTDAAYALEPLCEKALDFSEHAKSSSERKTTELCSEYRQTLLLPLHNELGVTTDWKNKRSRYLIGYPTRASSVIENSYQKDANISGIIANAVSELFDLLYRNCLYHYYCNQMSEGNDIFILENFPYQKREPGFFLNGTQWGPIYDSIVKEVEDEIVERGFYEYYAGKSDSACPVEVTGNKLYINRLRMHDNGVGYITGEWYDIALHSVPPVFLAEKPEEIRYILYCSESSVQQGVHAYDRETGAAVSHYYKTIAEFIVKDTVTGDIVLSRTYEVLPKRNMGSNNISLQSNIYGESSFKEELKNEILPALNSIIPVDSDWIILR